MQNFRAIEVRRLQQLTDGSDHSINSILAEERIDSAEAIKIEHWPSPGRARIPFNEAIQQRFTSFEKAQQIGPSWTQHWFRLHITIPSAWKHKERVTLEWDPSCEGMVFNDEGLTLQAITGTFRSSEFRLLVSSLSTLRRSAADLGSVGGFGIDRRVDVILDTKKQLQFKLYIACTCNGMFGNGLGETNNPPDNDRYFTLASADLVLPRMEAWRLLWDFIIIRVRPFVLEFRRYAQSDDL